MASEAQKQQRLLSSGFLNNLGSNIPELELNEVEKILVKFGSVMVEALQRNINTPGANGREITASGELSASIRFEYRQQGLGYVAEWFMTDYADFRDKGVQGVGPNNRNTTSPYRFKTAFPSKNMQNALLLYVREKNLLSDITAPKGLLGKNTRRILKNKDRRNTLAVAMGISIKRKGIEASNFKQKSIDEVMEDMTAELAKAMAMDIKISINMSKLY